VRYTTLLHHEDDLENGQCRHRWTHFVMDEASEALPSLPITIGPKFTEAEASIIAFALNAIADGHALLAADRELLWGDVGEDHGAAVYVGPTEGVAP
jgi:hypothetical protein